MHLVESSHCHAMQHQLTTVSQAFTKRERKSSTCQDGEVEKETLSSSTSVSDSKKSTEWFLETWATSGVQSTTRYRKGTGSRRSATSHNGRAYRGYPPHHGSRGLDFSTGSSSGRCGFSVAGSSSNSSSKKRGSILTGRVGGRPAPLARNAAAAPQMQHHHYHFSPSPHHHHQQQQHHPHQPLLHHLVNDPSSYTFYHPTAATSHGHVVDMTTPNSSDMEYDYPDPQLFPHHHHQQQQQQHHTMGRASSESAIDEPVTPEPPYGEEAGLMLPHLRGGESSHPHSHSHSHSLSHSHSHSHSLSHSHSHHQHHPGHGAPLSSYPLQGVVGVYDEVVDRYGWPVGGGGMALVGVEGTGYAQGY